MEGITREESYEMVGKGWKSLLDEIYDILPDSAYVSQVKEKFGGLRFYFSAHRDDMDIFDEVEDICERSYSICERCGEPGEEKRVRGWIKTLCDRCYIELMDGSSW